MKFLSASTIKDLEKCTWKYWAKKHLHLPDSGNAGSSRGTICHDIFELLLNDRRRHYHKLICETGTISSCPSVDRLVKIWIKKDPHLDAYDNKQNNNYELINDMIVVGLRWNFYREGENLFPPEKYFEISNEDPSYNFRGFIDKLSEDQGRIIITDYKSSSEPFSAKDLEMEIQAAAYSLWALKCEKKPSRVEFVFLRHPSNPVRVVEYSRDELLGFEHYFSDWQAFIDNITEDTAKLGLAWDKGYPEKDEGFGGRIMCGYPSHPLQTKKTGEKYYYCPYKFKFYYYGVFDGDDIIKTFSFNEKDKADSLAANKYEVRKLFYAGCPAHKNLNEKLEDDWQC